jgi:LmbE family N-acetylglucosaminyl deacetylase
MVREKIRVPTHEQILVLSPHPDDAAVSVGGLLQKPALRNSINILTLFGRSNHTRAAGYADAWQTVSRRRKREDTAFAARVGADLTYLDFPEAALRLRSYNQIFVDDATALLPIPRRLQSLTLEVIDRVKPALLLAPLGLRGHSDHMIVRELGRSIARRRGIAVIYYEDLIYASYLFNRQIIDHVRSVDPSLRPAYVSIKSELKSKLDNLMFYRSQLGSDAVQLIERYATHWKGREASERFWSGSASAEKFLKLI